MALDMVVKFVIILVVAAIVISLFIGFSEDAKDALRCLFFGCNEGVLSDFPRPISKSSFSSGEIASFIESCYETMSRVPEVNQSDTICYILMADSEMGSSANADDIRKYVSADIRDKIIFNTSLSKEYVRVEFRELGDEIIIS